MPAVHHRRVGEQCIEGHGIGAGRHLQQLVRKAVLDGSGQAALQLAAQVADQRGNRRGQAFVRAQSQAAEALRRRQVLAHLRRGHVQQDDLGVIAHRMRVRHGVVVQRDVAFLQRHFIAVLRQGAVPCTCSTSV